MLKRAIIIAMILLLGAGVAAAGDFDSMLKEIDLEKMCYAA